MNSFRTKSLRLGAILLTGCFAATAGAQVQYPVGAVVQPLNDSASEALSRHLRNLSEQPNSLHSLIGAGNSALELGDPQSALTFFARAEEAAPRDGRAKAGMGAAFVQMEQPQAALKFFADAVALGVDPRLIAGDRGLAFDMTGDTARAQADYALALQRGSDAEIEQRLALSKAISGDREGALAILEPQLQQQDRGAWRARAFVLALSGDSSEALQAANAAMPGQAAALRPFLERLPSLGAAERAMAVHFGRFPTQMARSVAPAGRPDRGEPTLGGVSSVASIGGSTSRRVAAATPRKEPKAAPTTRTITRNVPRVGSRFPIRETVVVKVEPEPEPAHTIKAGQPRPVQPLPTLRAQVAPAQAQPPAAKLDFADVAAAVQSLPEAVAPVKAAPAEIKPAKAAHPRRIWVQVAASQNKDGFPAEYKRLSRKAATLLAEKSAWTAPYRSTNRLLVGPFGSGEEARDLVNELAKLDIDSFSWTSAEGQEIEQLPTR